MRGQRNYLWSIKLIAALGLMVASTALAASNEKPTATDQPREVVTLPDGNKTVELGDRGLIPNVTITKEEKAIRTPLTPSDDTTLLGGGESRLPVSTEFWIGVRCSEVPPIMYEHLGIPRSQGAWIIEVVKDAPAAKAGLLANDILLTGNKKPVRGPMDVSRVVSEAREKPIQFELIRKGKHLTIEVVPEKNPYLTGKKKVLTGRNPNPSYPELDRFMKWFERQYPGQVFRPKMRLRFMHPGVILPADAPMHPSLPDGMSITIMKRGDEPTQVTVVKDGKKWEVDEHSLDKLPEEVRPQVDRMLQGIVVGPEMLPRIDSVPDWTDARSKKKGLIDDGAIRDQIEKQMQEMNRRIDELRKMVEGREEPPVGPEEKR